MKTTEKHRIMDADFIDGDLFFTTNHGNAMSIPDGEQLFMDYCHKTGAAQRFVEGDSDWYEYPMDDRDLINDFILSDKTRWKLDYDAMGEFYGDASEMVDEWTGNLTPSH